MSEIIKKNNKDVNIDLEASIKGTYISIKKIENGWVVYSLDLGGDVFVPTFAVALDMLSRLNSGESKETILCDVSEPSEFEMSGVNLNAEKWMAQ